MLDIFNDDAFSVTSLTDAVNKVPFVPGRAGQVVPWAEKGVNTLSIAIEERNGVLELVNPTQRGAAGQTAAKSGRSMRSLRVPHYQVDDAIFADEVQGVRSFGSETELETVQGLVASRMGEHVSWKLDPTLEYQRIGALKGVILNGDGSTLYDLFTEFGVTQETEVAFDLSATSPAAGALQKKCTAIDRLMAKNLGGVAYTGIGALVGDTFYDNLIAHPQVRDTYLGTQEARALREGPVAYRQIVIHGITFENYRGEVGGSPFIAADKAHFFPLGVPGLFRTIYAPADYVETVNTIGLPRYAKQYAQPNGKAISLEVQMNALNYCVRPKVLIKGKAGA